MTEKITAQQAIKAIGPGSVRSVMFRFEALGGGVAWIKTPKVHARAALRMLIPGATVHFHAYSNDGTVMISGPLHDEDRANDGDETL